ncbi:hypothetical protein [Oricola sp.]|uniref:hypothetical protein n=1 Tax=Oricola sp. TaxID=1979950 RepID=UPI003BA8914C
MEVETPDGIVTGTGVVQIRMRWLEDWQRFASANSVGSDVRGEAVVVEVAPGRYLFALVSWASYGLALKAFKEGDESPRQTSTRLQALRETRVLPRENYPRMVTFGHIGSPQTVRRVDPDNLAATFGPGYRLKSITLEITDAPVTRGELETVLGWLGEHPEPVVRRTSHLQQNCGKANLSGDRQ